MSLEQRGFNYPLEPYLQKLSWDVTRLDRQIVQVRQRLVGCRVNQQSLEQALEHQARRLQWGQHDRPDPSLQRHGLAYLTGLRGQLQAIISLIQAIQFHLGALLRSRQNLQTKLDNLRENRSVALVAYGRSLERRQALEADRDWLARQCAGTGAAAALWEAKS